LRRERNQLCIKREKKYHEEEVRDERRRVF